MLTCFEKFFRSSEISALLILVLHRDIYVMVKDATTFFCNSQLNDINTQEKI